MKVYAFRLKASKELYAFTATKDFADMFREQRNMSLFKEYILDLDKHEFMICASKLSNHKLCKDYLDDGDNIIEVVATINETTQLSESCEYIQDTVNFIMKDFNRFPFKKKYLKPIIKITQSITKRIDDTPTLNVNTFSLFYYLFRNTFSEYELPNSPNTNFLISYDET